MRIESLLLAFLFALAAAITGLRSWRLSRWVPVEAEVVHFELVGPFGVGPSRLTRQLELQRTGRGAMGPEVVYYTELVYVVDGVPHGAELAFDGPPDRKFPLRFNALRPSEYTARQPDYSPCIGLAALAVAALAYSFT